MDHDAAWKRLFDLPIVVEHLLRAFVGEVAGVLDLGSLRELSASWAGADAEQRHGDAVWRVPYADGTGRSLVLLLEFQSTVDQDMAMRVLRYQGMAFDALRRQGELDADGELRLLSVVVYSGAVRWKAPGGATRVTVDQNGEVLRSQPYLLLDTGQAAQDDLPADDIVAAVFHLDNAPSADDAVNRVWSPAGRLSERLEAAERDAVLGALIDWLAITLPKGPDGQAEVAVAGVLRMARNALLNREAGMTRLARRAREWEAEWLRQGTERGIEQGIERGIEQGIERGIEQGIESQRAMLWRQAERKFGSGTAAELARLLADVSDPVQLESVGDAIIDCETGRALIATVGL